MLKKELIGYRNIRVSDSEQKVVQIVKVTKSEILVQVGGMESFEFWKDNKIQFVAGLGEIQRMFANGMFFPLSDIEFDEKKNLFLLPNGGIIQR